MFTLELGANTIYIPLTCLESQKDFLQLIVSKNGDYSNPKTLTIPIINFTYNSKYLVLDFDVVSIEANEDLANGIIFLEQGEYNFEIQGTDDILDPFNYLFQSIMTLPVNVDENYIYA